MSSGGNPYLETQSVAAGIEEYSPNHNFFINVYFGKIFMGYLTGGAMNKTHF